jgi:hypothetical protein
MSFANVGHRTTIIANDMSFSVSILSAGLIAAILLLLVSSHQYKLPPGPSGNVAGEFTNASMPEVINKWRRKYGT